MDLYINNFNVRVSESINEDIFSGKSKSILELMSDTNLLKFSPTVIIADPFLFVHNDTLYLFYENQVSWYGRGRICMRKTNNLKDWSNEKEVLKESFHLSFPYVFENDGKVYMIPETGHDGSIRLYEAKDEMLENWSLKAKLIDDGSDWVDSSLTLVNGSFFLFTSKKVEGKPYNQHLFYSKQLLGPYVEHKKSPIYKGNDHGRNAGAIFSCEGGMYRPTQDCSVGYGDNVSIFKINMLSEDDYSESLFKKDILERNGAYKNGGHQFSFVEFHGERIVATDFKSKNYNFFELGRRIIRKLK